MRIACIDIGTLTCRLLIAEIHGDGSLREICGDRRVLRLGEGVDEARVLSDEAMTRVMDVMHGWRRTIASYDVDAVVAVATSAVRDARNRQVFVDRVTQDVGIELEVLSGEEEARRTWLGVQFGLSGGVSDALALDIGGGSTEFIRGTADYYSAAVSVDVGVVRVTERCVRHDPPTSQDIASVSRLVESEVGRIRPQLEPLSEVTLVGTAGTVTTLAAVAQGLSRYDPSRVHNYVLSLETLVAIEKRLLALTARERLDLSGIEPGREHVIVAGTVILRTVMQLLEFQACRVSDYGLREGVVVDVWRRAQAK